MKQKYLALGSTLVLLLLAVAACSPRGKAPASPGATGPAPSPTEAVAPTAPPTPPPEESPPPEVAPDALEHFNSYRLRVSYQQTVEGEASEVITMEQEETRDPRAMRILLTSEGGETIELVQIGDTAWMCSTEGDCIQTQQSAEEAATEFGASVLLDPTDIANSEDYQYVGRETVNGIRSRHYVITVSPATLTGVTQGTVTRAKADVWVADEPGQPSYVARLVLHWEGAREGDGKPISGTWTYEIYDVNKPITIQPPSGAPTIPQDIPLCSGATRQTAMGNTLLFACPDSLETVAEFYRTEMPRQGWTAGEESNLGNMVTQEWSKGNRKATLMLVPGDTGGCNVMVTTE